ncbi:MAG: RNA-binding S4 domain-containing protein [Nitrosomonas sp.]|nr:RNA-binding S4 domain-containing protein [Nitrosomonas sp.]
MIAVTDCEKFRIDKWLFAARFFKTRALAAEAVERGRVLVNGVRVKPARTLVVGNRLIIRMDQYQYEIEVLALSNRRGPYAEAQKLYQETDASRQLRAAIMEKAKAEPPQFYTKGRPTKRDRRELDRFKG